MNKKIKPLNKSSQDLENYKCICCSLRHTKLPVRCDLVRSNTLSFQLEGDKPKGLHKRAIAPSLLRAFSFLNMIKTKFSGESNKILICHRNKFWNFYHSLFKFSQKRKFNKNIEEERIWKPDWSFNSFISSSRVDWDVVVVVPPLTKPLVFILSSTQANEAIIERFVDVLFVSPTLNTRL